MNRPTAASRKTKAAAVETRAVTFSASTLSGILRRIGGRASHEAAAAYRQAIKDDEDRVQAVLDSMGLDFSELTEALQEELIAVFQAGGEGALREVLAGADEKLFGGLNAAARDYAADRAAELVTALEETTRDGLRGTIERAFSEGLLPADLAGEIRDAFEFSDSRAEMIARTELADAHIQGSLEGWKESGVVEGKSWILSNDHDEPDECDEGADLGVVPIDGDFGGLGDPPAHPRCNCDVLPELIAEGE